MNLFDGRNEAHGITYTTCLPASLWLVTLVHSRGSEVSNVRASDAAEALRLARNIAESFIFVTDDDNRITSVYVEEV